MQSPLANQRGLEIEGRSGMRTKKTSDGTKGFTLIELLIVIAIILILIAIALPNFLQAQVRAKVTKVAGDLRSIGQALDAYYLEWGYYPYESESTWARHHPINEHGLKKITTPIAYISEIPEDPFGDHLNAPPGELRKYYGGGCRTEDIPYYYHYVGPIYVTFSRGPQQVETLRATEPNFEPYTGELVTFTVTNGTKSAGSFQWFNGEGAWWGVRTKESGGNVCRKQTLRNPRPEMRPGIIVDKIFYLGRRPHNSF